MQLTRVRSCSSNSTPSSPEMRRPSRRRELSVADISFGNETKEFGDHVEQRQSRQLQRRDAICSEVDCYYRETLKIIYF